MTKPSWKYEVFQVYKDGTKRSVRRYKTLAAARYTSQMNEKLRKLAEQVALTKEYAFEERYPADGKPDHS
jgi:hypothetical protein